MILPRLVKLQKRFEFDHVRRELGGGGGGGGWVGR